MAVRDKQRCSESCVIAKKDEIVMELWAEEYIPFDTIRLKFIFKQTHLSLLENSMHNWSLRPVAVEMSELYAAATGPYYNEFSSVNPRLSVSFRSFVMVLLVLILRRFFYQQDQSNKKICPLIFFF